MNRITAMIVIECQTYKRATMMKVNFVKYNTRLSTIYVNPSFESMMRLYSVVNNDPHVYFNDRKITVRYYM